MDSPISLRQFLINATHDGPPIGLLGSAHMPSPGRRFSVRTVDAAGMTTLSGLFTAFSRAWEFGKSFGYNKDSFDDCMRDLDGRALSAGAGRVVTMDADLSHDPERLDALLDAADGADLVVGSRYVPGGGAVDSPFLRRLLSRTANLGAHAALGLATRDATAGFRVWRRGAAAMLLSAGLVSSGYSFLLEATFLAEERGLAVAEVPIRFRDRDHTRLGEIAAGAWLPVPMDESILFDVAIDQRWEKAYALLGLTPAVGMSMRTVGSA